VINFSGIIGFTSSLGFLMMYLPNLILMSGLNFILPLDKAIKVSFETKISFGSIMFTKIYLSSSLYMDFFRVICSSGYVC